MQHEANVSTYRPSGFVEGPLRAKTGPSSNVAFDPEETLWCQPLALYFSPRCRSPVRRISVLRSRGTARSAATGQEAIGVGIGGWAK
jgi:hypothetical protein